jgi:UPF0271 protein
LIEQIDALDRIAARHGAVVGHVKPHGALYNQAAENPDIAGSIVQTVRAFRPGLRLVGLAGSTLLKMAREAGIPIVGEGFADRRYRLNGLLVSRDEPGALIQDPAEAARQAVSLAHGHAIDTKEYAKASPAPVGTICVHGDTPGALAIARAVRAALEEAGITIRAFGREERTA